MFTTSYSFSYDPSKKNILIIKASDRYSYIFGFIDTIAKRLSSEYNIFYILFDKTNTEHCTIKINEQNIKKSLKTVAYTKESFKKEFPDSSDHHSNINHQKLEEIIGNAFPKLPSVDYILIGYDVFFMLPYGKITGVKTLRNQYNEFHDYVGTDEHVVSVINSEIDMVCSEIYKQFNPLAFSQFRQAIIINIIKYLTKEYKSTIKSLDGFVIDPAHFHPMYKLFDVPHRLFYFENDTRGTRCFEKFPIAQLQHCVYDINKQSNINTEKEKLFFFAGTVFSNKINRIKVYEDFLRYLRLENSSLYIPLTKGGIYKENPSDKVINRNEQRILANYEEELYLSVKNHPMHKGHILPEDLYAELGLYKYAFVARCTSFNDSLNYRPVLYVQNNVLPIIDHMYDPEYLSIPKEIYDKISVKNHTEIVERIQYFEEHPEERLEIINKLKDLFEIHKFYESNYVEELIRNTWK